MARVKTATTDSAATAKARSGAYSAAERRLRDAHADEFHDLMAQECGKVGVTYVRKLTAEEKAAATVATLLAEFGPGIIPVTVAGADSEVKTEKS